MTTESHKFLVILLKVSSFGLDGYPGEIAVLVYPICLHLSSFVVYPSFSSFAFIYLHLFSFILFVCTYPPLSSIVPIYPHAIGGHP